MCSWVPRAPRGRVRPGMLRHQPSGGPLALALPGGDLFPVPFLPVQSDAPVTTVFLTFLRASLFRPGPFLVIAAAALFVPRSGLSAQTTRSRWFPELRYFEAPAAGLREPTFALRGFWTDVFEDTSSPRERPAFAFDPNEDLSSEMQGEAALGGHIRLWEAATWEDGGIVLGVQSGVFGRFRLESSAADLVSSDWLVSFPAEWSRGAWSGRVRLSHWSSHLGDELVETTGAERLDFTSETLDAIVAYTVRGLRVYGGGGLVSRSSLENEDRLGPDFSDDVQARLGADGQWYLWRDETVGIEAAVDWQSWDRTHWNSRVSIVGGFTARTASGRWARLVGRFMDGPSPLGQFFRTDETLWGFELVISL